MATRKRKKYSAEARAKILATAAAEGLTATDVKKRFGVTPVTYYSWRKKTGAAPRRAKRAGGSGLDDQLRSQVKARIQRMIPEIIRSEVDAQLAALFGAAPRKRGRPRKQ